LTPFLFGTGGAPHFHGMLISTDFKVFQSGPQGHGRRKVPHSPGIRGDECSSKGNCQEAHASGDIKRRCQQPFFSLPVLSHAIFISGLVVLEATYGPIDRDEDAHDLILDVTVPLQALVHHSQLYIAGHQTKVSFKF
jgi:hypothetical protein